MDSLAHPKRILIVKPSSLGDIVHAFPLVDQIRHHDPDAIVDWVANREFVPLVQRHSGVRRVFSFPRSDWGKASFFSSLNVFRHDLRMESYDFILDAQGLLRSAMIARLARGKEIIGFEDAREGAPILYSQRVRVTPESGGFVHAVHRNLTLLEPLGLVAQYRPASLRFTEEDRLKLASILAGEGLSEGGKYIVVHPGAKRAIKQWPPIYFSELLTRLKQVFPDVSLVLVGSAADRDLLAEISGRTRVSPVVLAGKVPVDLLPLLFGPASLYIGNDSGPLHLAVLSGTRSLSFYGSSSPGRTGPFGDKAQHITMGDPVPCSPCGDFRLSCSHQSCLVGVTPEQVVDRILEMFGPKFISLTGQKDESQARRSA